MLKAVEKANLEKVRPQGGPAAQSVGGDEEENRVFLLVVGLGSQVIFVNILVINFIIIFS